MLKSVYKIIINLLFSIANLRGTELYIMLAQCTNNESKSTARKHSLYIAVCYSCSKCLIVFQCHVVWTWLTRRGLVDLHSTPHIGSCVVWRRKKLRESPPVAAVVQQSMNITIYRHLRSCTTEHEYYIYKHQVALASFPVLPRTNRIREGLGTRLRWRVYTCIYNYSKLTVWYMQCVYIL